MEEALFPKLISDVTDEKFTIKLQLVFEFEFKIMRDFVSSKYEGNGLWMVQSLINLKVICSAFQFSIL